MKKLKLIYGCLGSHSNDVIRKSIVELVEAKTLCLYIVPEQQTVIAEAAMAKLLPSSAPLCFEVTNFSRLAETVFRQLGGISYNYVDDTARALIMWRTLAELSPIISEFSFSDPESVSTAISAVSDLRTRGITPSELERASDELPDSSLRKKLRDLSMIQTLSGAMLSEKYDDSYDDLDRLAELLTKEKIFDGYHIFIDGFVSFTAQEYRVVRALCARCDLTVALPLPSRSCEKLQFAEARRFESGLRDIAEATGAELVEESARAVQIPPIVAHFADSIGELSQKSYVGDTRGLRVIRAEDPYRASDFIACDILRRVQDEGASFSDFAIIVRDAQSYSGIIDSMLERRGIPCFFSSKTDLSSLEPVKLIHSAYAVISNGWRRGDVISFLKCGLSGISADECDEFEDYTARWHINGTRFTDGIAWNMNPDGYTSTRTDYGNALLARVNETRERLTSLLLRFAEAQDEAETIRDHCVALYGFLTELSLPDKLRARAEEAAHAGDSNAADEYGRLWKLICDSLDTLCDVLAEVEADSGTFTRLLELVFGGAALGRIPTYCDQVIIGAADMIRVDDPKHVYILGANKDEFPRAVSDSGLFGSADRTTLRELGLDLGEDVAFLSSRELFYFYRALLFASEGTDIIYTSFGNLKSPNEPASELLPLLSADSPAKKIDASSLPLEFYIREKSTAKEFLRSRGDSPALAALIDFLKENEEASEILRKTAPLSVGELSLKDATARKTFGDNISLTQSRISTFTECPFQHFGRYVLKLDPKEEAEINYRDIGNYIHHLLEVFFRQLAKEGRHLSEIPEEELAGIAEEITNQYINEICPDGRAKTARLMRLFERLSRNALVMLHELRDEFAASEFDPALFELPLEREDEARPSPLRIPLSGGGVASVYGVIDRVDRFERNGDVYLRVVDYKSGSHKFNFSNIASGSDLQLVIYLMSLTSTDKEAFRRLLGCAERGRLLPAGAICLTAGGDGKALPTPSDPASGISRARKTITRSGVLLGDPEILSAMDSTEAGKFLPVKSTKEGERKAEAGSLLVSLDEMTELFSNVAGVIAGIGDEIRSGKINTAGHVKQTKSRSEIAKRCESCQMKPICRKPVHK